ncbi:methylcrotonoyl-CoA carboxylase beta chain, mitochondrial-like isoform X2 [Stegodyphus dumicola]|uniref:methylcrotonoyl-CoA carboxylase beta chain, mitochondrial-like isoform X2 n=1 Tax=Stegodyphus dumicola TaxID=202533 RepID=UPI0015AD7D07|nr:methylcrotonoyl-CoA carboxylase beta chain, mitochondrial-like isoform X2 [Stegodyphus dumicola]
MIYKRIDEALKYDLQEEDVIENAKTRSAEAAHALKVLSEYARAGGGPRGIHRHTVVNKKLLVRDRLKLLFDPDSPFLEIGLFAGMSMDYGHIPAAGSVAGIGKIHGHFCIVGANDATVKGGAFFPISIVKQIRVQQLSYLNRLPCIYLVDSAGAYLPLQADIFPDKEHGGRTFYNEAVLSSLGIPQIAVVCGSSTAGGAYCPTMAEEAIIVKKSGVVFLGGPPLVKAATGEIVSEQDLGGADMHCSISGCTDYYAEDEEEAFMMCRESVLTLNLPQCSQITYQEPLYSSKDLTIISGKETLCREDMYVILSRILDGSMFKEFKAKFGINLITGFGYIHGMLVGILANCNALTFEDAQKGTHMIQLCEKRNIPLIFLQNSGCFKDGNHSHAISHDSLLKDRAKMVAAHSSAAVPKITLCINGCFEDDNFTMCGWPFSPNFFFAWPLAHISSSRKTVEKAVATENNILKELSSTENMNEFETLFENHTSAFYHASVMKSDGIISPQDTREVLALCLKIVPNSNNSSLAKHLPVFRM